MRSLASAFRSSRPVADRRREWPARVALCGHIGAGVLLGLSRQAPWLWPLGAISLILWAAVIVRTPRTSTLVLGIALSQIVSHALWLRWSFGMTGVFFSNAPGLAR